MRKSYTNHVFTLLHFWFDYQIIRQRHVNASKQNVNVNYPYFFTARRYASAVYAVVVSPSVRPSVTSRHYTKTAIRRITQPTPYDSPGTLGYSTVTSTTVDTTILI